MIDDLYGERIENARLWSGLTLFDKFVCFPLFLLIWMGYFIRYYIRYYFTNNMHIEFYKPKEVGKK
jgi:hypothetical protein